MKGIVADTSGIVAAFDLDSPYCEGCRRALTTHDRVFTTPFVVAEVDYLLSTRIGTAAADMFLDELCRGAYQLVNFNRDEFLATAAVIGNYRALNIGITDASLAVAARQIGTTCLLTLDERHFRAVTPLTGEKAFTLLPSDA